MSEKTDPFMEFKTRIAHAGEPTGKTYLLRTQTIEDLLFKVPVERLPQALNEISASVMAMAGVLEGLRLSGVPEELIREGVRFPEIHEWVDDGKGEVGFRVRTPEEPGEEQA